MYVSANIIKIKLIFKQLQQILKEYDKGQLNILKFYF